VFFSEEFWISFSSISGPQILLLSVQFEKNTPFPIFATFAFSKNVIHEYKVKVSSSLGPLISPVRQGPCGLNPALLGEIPPRFEFPPHRPLLCPAVKTTTCHFPTVNLVSYYT